MSTLNNVWRGVFSIIDGGAVRESQLLQYPQALSGIGEPDGWEHNWSEYIRMGIHGGFKGSGGCNDLIFSDHGVTNMCFILAYRV